jgi:putative ABC transport system substrate-binding protein
MRCRVAILIGIWFLATLVCTKVVAEPLTVVYPQVKAPYDEIFKQIIRGVEHQQQGHLQLVEIDSTTSLDQVAKDLAKDPTIQVIALGKSSYQVAQQVQRTNAVVVGALPLQSSNLAGISLLTDPKVLLDSLKMLAPSITRVHVVYSESSRWLINAAIEQAPNYGIEVVAEQVNDLKEAVNRYQDCKVSTQPPVPSGCRWMPLP